MTDPPLLALSAVSKSFSRGWSLRGGRRSVRAVDGVDLELYPGRTVALVGESGSGKSTTALMALGLLAPDSGSVSFAGRALTDYSRREFRERVRPRIQAVFQDPASALNPRKTIYETLRSARALYGLSPKGDERADVVALLDRVGLSPGERYLNRQPHELSGGQLQRVGIARALAVEPDVIIADEPVSALDVSIRGQILNLLTEVQEARGISILLITHDLTVVATTAHEVAVMYLGRIVENGPTAQVLRSPQHAYTQTLLAATPRIRRDMSTTAARNGTAGVSAPVPKTTIPMTLKKEPS